MFHFYSSRINYVNATQLEMTSNISDYLSTYKPIPVYLHKANIGCMLTKPSITEQSDMLHILSHQQSKTQRFIHNDKNKKESFTIEKTETAKVSESQAC